MKRGGEREWITEFKDLSDEGKSIVRTIDRYSSLAISREEALKSLLIEILKLLRANKVIKIQKSKSLVCIVKNQESKSTLVYPDYRLILDSDCHTWLQKAYHSVRRLSSKYSRSTPSIKTEELLSMNFAEKRKAEKIKSVKFYARHITLV